MHTKESLKGDLKALGLREDDIVLIHSSLKSIGEVEGRADSVLSALEEYLSKGLLILPTLTWSIVNDKQPVYSVLDSPSSVGALTEIFRKRPGVHRSLHPTHSLAAKGPRAAEFVAGHEKFDSPAHKDSPWGRIYSWGGKIMFLGTGQINSNTFLHGVEEWLPVPGMLTETHQHLIVFDEKGNRYNVPSRRHVGAHSRWYHLLEKEYREAGAITEGTFGDAKVLIMDAVKVGDITFEQLKKEPFFFTDEYQYPRQEKK